MSKLKILHTVESYHPSVGGMQEVVRQLSERLVSFGHEVTIGTSYNKNRQNNEINGVKIKSYQLSGSLARGIKGDPGSYENELINGGYDIICNFAAQQWATDLALPLLNKIKSKKIFIPTGFSSLYEQSHSQYYDNMKSWIRQYDANIFLSYNYRDIIFAKENRASRITVIPNGSDEREFIKPVRNNLRKKLNISEDSFLVLLVGSHTLNKGHYEAIKIFKNAAIPNSTLLIIGNHFSDIPSIICQISCHLLSWTLNTLKLGGRIIVKEMIRGDTINAYYASDVFLFPSNIECSPIVLFEAASAGLPFLATDVGNSKEIVEWTGGGVILPTNTDALGKSHAVINLSSEILAKMAKDSKWLSELSSKGLKSWQDNYSWDKITRKYEQLYIDINRSQ